MKQKLSSFTVIVTFIALAVMGLALVPRLPVKLSPGRVTPSLTVSFDMPNTSARVIESEVTSKLESMLARIQGVKEVKSVSSNGSGRITLGLDKHADIEAARFEASTIVRQAWSQLPDGLQYPRIMARQADNGASRPFMTYTLNAPATPFEIQNYAEENIKPAIGQIKGVNKIELSGAMPMEWRLQYDSEKLRSLGLSPNDIINAIRENSRSQYLGIAQSAGDWIRVNVRANATNEDFDPNEIALSTKDGRVVNLEQLVKVEHVEAEPKGYYRINGLNSIYCNITADDDANQLDLAKQVKLVLAELKPKMPQGYQTTLSYDATETIDEELDKIYFRTGLTLVILLVFVTLITLNLRYMLIITISLLINLAVAVILYYVLGIEIQLYSLAGITISLNLIIDNIIVMTDHITHKGNLRAFTSVMAATLTTIGALGIVFFLDEDLRLKLQDFVAVVIINLGISLLVALFLVPALITKIGLIRKKEHHKSRRASKFGLAFTRFYDRFIGLCLRRRVILIVVLVLLFGLPVFMLPEKVDGEGKWAELYNSTIGSKNYKEKVRPWVDKCLGGTLRLFAKEVYEGSYFNREDNEPVISIYATLPNGSTLDQMNELIKKMESYLTGFDQIRQFQTSISDARRAYMVIYFTKEAANSYFPYRLKSDIIAKAQTLGGGSWSVYGLQDQGFNNDVRESAGSYRAKMYGYNYDDLEKYAAAFKEKLLGHRRIKEVNINSEFQWYKDDYSEYYLEIDRTKLAKEKLTVSDVYAALVPIFGRDMNAGMVLSGTNLERVSLRSKQSEEYDVWALSNAPLTIGDKTFKLGDFATVEHRLAPPSIAKENQQYVLCLQFEYIGSMEQGRKILNKDIEEFSETLPIGYSVENADNYWSWRDRKGTNYWLLLLVVGIIFFTTSILFNSLKQPIAIIFTIPISFIGVFLIFYLTKMNFDQGGFAAFILLCGITVNASIYILNEYNMLRERFPRRTPRQLYLKAWNTKIMPIFLTVVSTILGFIPFMIGTGKESFWFPLALGTIGGLAMSLIGIFVFLPIFSLARPKTEKRPKQKKKFALRPLKRLRKEKKTEA